MSNAANEDQLVDRVRAVLDCVLRQAGFPGSDELARQVPRVGVVGGPITMLELRVSQATPASTFTDGPIPLSTEVSDESGMPIGELLIWVDGGYLSALEFAWWTDDPPHQLPTPSRLKVTRR